MTHLNYMGKNMHNKGVGDIKGVVIDATKECVFAKSKFLNKSFNK